MKRPLIFACAAVLACACAFWLVAQRDRAPREAPPAPSSAASASSASAPALESDAPAAQHESAAAAPRAPSLAPEPVTGPSATLVVVCVDEHDGRALPDLGVRVQRSVAATDAHATQGAGPGFSGCISPRDDAGSRWQALTDEYAPPRSDSIGRVSIVVPAATSLRVGLATSNVYQRAVPLGCPALAEGETRELRLPIRRANDARFRGLVVDAGSGDPLAGVRVSTSERSQSELVATTGNDGRFEMPATSWEVTHARLELEGFVALTIPVDVSGDEPGSEHRLQLVRGAVVCGHLLDEHGAPLQMSSIRLAGPAGFEARAFCEADGAFELDGLPPGVAFAVDLERWRRTIQEADPLPPLAAGERRTLELRVAPGSAFEGVVVDENHQPVAGVSLWLVRAPRDGLRCGSRELRERAELSLTSDAQGRFACSGLQPGTWALALDAHYTLPSVPTIVNLPLAPGTIVEVLHFQSANIRGRVVDPEGKPVASASVSFALEGCAEKVWIRADADGSFFEGVHGPWTYRVQAGGEFSASSSEPVLARGGGDELVLRQRRGGRLAVRVRGPQGAVVRGRVICAIATGAAPEAWTTRRYLDGSDQAVLPAPEGSVRILAQDEDGRWSRAQNATLHAAADDASIELETVDSSHTRIESSGFASSLQVRVLCEGILVEELVLLPASSLEFELPAGPLELEYRLEGSRQDWTRRTVTTRAGVASTIVLAP